MKRTLRILKSLTLWILLLFALLVVVAFVFREFGSKPHGPQGELIDIGNHKLHIRVDGKKNNNPTVVIEGGSGMATEYYHWLSEGLKDSLRVVRYDRSGIGYSEASSKPRDPESIAQELHLLLKSAGVEPPYIMVGHSMGGPFTRVYQELYPAEVQAMVLLDATHPERAQRITSIPMSDSFVFKASVWSYKLQGILADLGIIYLYDQVVSPLSIRQMAGLPDTINERTSDFIRNGKHLRTMGAEHKSFFETLDRSGQKTYFDSLPILIFPSEISTIPDEDYDRYLKRGIDLRKNQTISKELQQDYLNLSTNCKLIELPGDHSTIFTERENAEVICNEILELSLQL